MLFGLVVLVDIKQIDLPVLMNQLPDSDGVLIGYAGQTIAGITLPSGKKWAAHDSR